MEPVAKEASQPVSPNEAVEAAHRERLAAKLAVIADELARSEDYRAKRDEDKRRILEGYSDLPTLPPELSPPDYLVDDQISYSKGDAALEFYNACAHGDLEKVRDCTQTSKLPQADLQYGLEQAAHAFEVDVVRYLLKEQNTQLHTRAFGGEDDIAPYEGRNIFLHGSPKLRDLLAAFLDNGWHPNQVIYPEKKKIRVFAFRDDPPSMKMKVALHHRRCVEDLEILRLLLEHGADPTIACHLHATREFGHFYYEAPLARKSGDILHIAVEMGSTEAVDLLVSHGAKPVYGSSLHRLIEGFHMETETRFAMADYMLSIGDDINGLRNV